MDGENPIVRAVIQRVREAQVKVDGKVVGKIEAGIVTLLGVAVGDDAKKAEALIEKIIHLRIFEDDAGKMNRSLLDVGGEHLIVSQFTLLADCSTGRRPSFTGAEKPELAKSIYERALAVSRGLGVKTAEGIFQADMWVSLVNDGPVTIVLEI